MPSILSGVYPVDPDVLPTASKYPHNLFTLLGKRYDMNVYENRAHLCPTAICGTARTAAADETGFSTLVSNSARLWYDFAKPTEQTDRLEFDVESHPHELDVGDTFVRSPDAVVRDRAWTSSTFSSRTRRGTTRRTATDYHATGIPGLGFYYEWLDEGGALAARQRHLLQVQATDRLIGRIVAKLKRIHAYDDSLVVVTADHGVAFTKGSLIRGVAKENYPEIMWTPLIVKAPRQTNGRGRRPRRARRRPPADDRRPSPHQDAVEGRRPLAARCPEGGADPAGPRMGLQLAEAAAGPEVRDRRRAPGLRLGAARCGVDRHGRPRPPAVRLGGYAGLIGTRSHAAVDPNAAR